MMTTDAQPRLLLPDAPVVVAGASAALILTPDGEIRELAPARAAAMLRETPPILCHMPITASRLGMEHFASFDLLELFAFVRPARFCLPTPKGLTSTLDLPEPRNREDEAQSLIDVAEKLLRELATTPKAAEARAIAWMMARGNWSWGPAVLAALGVQGDVRGNAYRVWDKLGEWSDHAPPPAPGHIPVDPAETRERLAQMLGPDAENRPSQADYASAATHAFLPRDVIGAPKLVLAEAGTGTGKTLGYIAPASLWAQKNEAPVWISTYTRNLQRQLDGELDRLFPDLGEKSRKVVIRKGRENYLCLLNLEDSLNRARPQDAVPNGLMLRWTSASRDGDMVGGDMPGWLPDIISRARSLGLADRRGECIYSSCQHFSKCFIEKAVRRARRAEIVIANHALVMIQAALGGLDDASRPTRYVFDEGHHVFDAADSAFSSHLTGAETAELRRWLLGAEEGGRSRARGLKRRAEDLVAHSDEAAKALEEALHEARCLPGPAWHQRIAEGQPLGPAEKFLSLLRQQVYARAGGQNTPYSIECEVAPPIPGLAEAARDLDDALRKLTQPLKILGQRLSALLDDEAAELESSVRQRIEGVCRSLERRALVPLGGWRHMLAHIFMGEEDARFVDWFSVDRIAGRDADMGMHRHWIDPTIPFASTICENAHGLLITSATLRDGSGDTEKDWEVAERRTGAALLPEPPVRAALPSPFDYIQRTRVYVVTDVRKDDMAQVSAAYRELFLAAGGGGLGLFTAISRLREVHKRLAQPLQHAGLPLYGQHVDNMDLSTLVDIFRAEENACLLGTDAVRDGVDVPGRSLRLIVFDRVPWPRPDILHKARRAAFGGKAYDDLITRLRLKQAFGRLVRRGDDAGVFVLLDPMMPSRLFGAFPDGLEVKRCGLAEAIAETRDFLARTNRAPAC